MNLVTAREIRKTYQAGEVEVQALGLGCVDVVRSSWAYHGSGGYRIVRGDE